MPDSTTDDPWGTRDLDLTAYLDRIGQPEREPSRVALAALHRAHRRTFPFENIDVLLDQHPGVSVAAVQAKLLGLPRGGYCFEQSVLLAAALELLGYAVRRHLSRTRHPRTSPRTHLVSVIELDGQRLLCDVGMGWTLLEPMPLVDGAEVTQDGWRFRLTRREEFGTVTWELARINGEQWEPMHWIEDSLIHPIDVEVAHHYTSTHPLTYFRSSLVVGGLGRGPSEGSVLGISLDGVTERRPGVPTRHTDLPTDAHEIGRQLARLGIRPTYEELDRLTAKIAEIRASTPAE